MTLLTRKALVLAKLEAKPGVSANPTVAGGDSILCSKPDFSVDVNKLERGIVRSDLSPEANQTGRLLSKFKFDAELRGNGKSQSGNVLDAPIIGRLLQACGFSVTPVANTAAARTSAAISDMGNKSQASWSIGGAPVQTHSPVLITVFVATGGASGVATVNVTSSDSDVAGPDVLGEIVTSGTPLDLGTTGVDVTPEFTSALVAGDSWSFWLTPVGLRYAPLSDEIPTVTIHAYFDGLFHEMTYCNGTFKLSAEAGKLATISFEFWGQYHPTLDIDLPDDDTEDGPLPAQVQLSALTWGGNRDLVASSWSYDLGAKITPRPDVNGTDGYSGFRLTERKSTGGFDPEATLEAKNPFWADLASGRAKTFSANVGLEPGNIVGVFGPRVQTDSLGYKDRDGLRAYDVGLAFRRLRGNDEISFFFC